MNRDINNELYAIWLTKEVSTLNSNKEIHIQENDIKRLPASCFLWIGDRDKKNKWYLPYRSGTGEVVNGVYESAGAVSIPILKAIATAMSEDYPSHPIAPHQIKTKIKKLLKQYNINDYQEATMNEKKTFSMTEATMTGQFRENKIDKKARTISNVAIMRASTPNIYIGGTKGTVFTENFRKQVASFLSGTKAYVDHTSPWKKEDTGGVRSSKDVIGFYENGRLDSDGVVRGDLHYLSSESAWLEPRIEEMADKCGLSIDASGIMEMNAETEMAEAIECTQLKSVDLVTEPGSTVNIFESKTEEHEEEEIMDLSKTTLAELLESRPDLVATIKESATKDLSTKGEIETLKAEVEKLTEANKVQASKLDEYQVAEKLAEKTEVVESIIAESKIPEEGITDVFKSQLMEAKDDEARQALIDDRKALMEGKKTTKKSGVTGMGDENTEEEIQESTTDITSEFKSAVEA